ncbi:MAG: membrane-bound lytic murein transglycosylase D [Desulfobacteraceae bacterium Eth-SRB2]|nr:MAG: membrane-bound lytic murein transglycosylase D [Desulfobacteraceae bacterium Eth-SRB2]
MKLRILFLPVFLLFFLGGCIQTLQNTPVSQNVNYLPARTGDTSSAKSIEKGNLKDQKPPPVDNLVAENTIEAPATIKKDKNKIAEDSLLDKEIQSTFDEALDFCQASQDFWQKGELENALEALDHAYSLILKIDTDDTAELIQQKEDLRYMISKRILEIYASRNIVVNGNHNAIPIVMNKHIQKEIDRFTKKGEKKFFIESYKRSGKYRPQIVSALKKAGLPVELSWLPLIESGFKANALSKARALGLWQFIPSTGYKFGLNRDKYIDGRLDPVKSTKAAIEYLTELHHIFGDWSTVLAAYNCGEGKVLRVIRTQNINYLDNFWDLYESLPLETARYVPRFLATLHIINNLEMYGLDSVPVDKPLEYQIIMVSKQVHLRNVAKTIGVTEKTLIKLNPELRYRILPKDNYPLRVPPDKGQILLAKLDEMPVSYPPQRAYVYHRIRSGESLSTISRRYRCSVKSIMRANNLRRSSFIVAGKKLKIPRKGSIVYRSKKYNRIKDSTASSHVVKSGDSLWIIANRYGTTTKKIQELNSLSTANLHIGQVLKIRERKGESKDDKPAGEYLKTYLVKPGDSPYQIAQLHKMPLERFIRINRLTPRNKIFPGQRLYVE